MTSFLVHTGQHYDVKAPYAVSTLHRPSNVDDMKVLKGLIDTLLEISQRMPIIFPIHPRTKKALASIESLGSGLYFGPPQNPRQGIHCMDPIGYLDFMSLILNASLVLTDSGGIQEETTVLGIPCLTLRENTRTPDHRHTWNKSRDWGDTGTNFE
jgi:UDP-N-acetylglucosamine 2-epimerase (non-hydrolysing)